MSTPKIDAYFRQMYASGERRSSEEIARAIGDDPKLCEGRLRDAVSMYLPKWEKLFKGAIFVAAEKRLWATDGIHMMEYRVRADPNAPESYENQQTSMGLVILYEVLDSLNAHR